MVLGDVLPAVVGLGLARGGDAGGRPGWDGDNRLAFGDLAMSELPARDLDDGSGDGAGDGALFVVSSLDGDGDMMRSSADDAPVAVDRAPPLAVGPSLDEPLPLPSPSSALWNVDSSVGWSVSFRSSLLMDRKNPEAPEAEAEAEAEADTDADALPPPPASVVASDTTEKIPPCEEAMVLSRS